MSRSTASQHPSSTHDGYDEDGGDTLSPAEISLQTSPIVSRRPYSARASDLDVRSKLPSKLQIDESSGLLAHTDGLLRNYTSEPNTSKPRFSRHQSSVGSLRGTRNHSRSSSWGVRLASAVGSGWRRSETGGLSESKGSLFTDERVWYDQFTSTDWVHDSIADNFRVRDLRARNDFRGRLHAWFDGAEGWILVAIVGCITACVAYFVDVCEASIFDLKQGYCTAGWYFSQEKCCFEEGACPAWRTWGDAMQFTGLEKETINLIAYVIFVVLFSVASCILTLTTKTVIPSSFSLSTLDENLGAVSLKNAGDMDSKARNGDLSPTGQPISELQKSSTMIYYPAAGSGVAEVKVILSGFVVHGYLGVQTLVVKTLALVLSVASGLSLGKEGPYVHIATCIGNIACRMFPKYNHNDGKRREVLSASAASGVAVAFGAPIAGVLFSLEEVSYYFPPKTLFRTFFCSIAAALSLKFLNPYGTGKIVIFEIRYVTDWRFFEMAVFILLGVLGGALGAIFIKASRIWARTFRRVPMIKRWPVLEVVSVALITGLVSFWNRYTKLAVTELLFELARPCGQDDLSGLCPQRVEQIPEILWHLCFAFVIKSLLTTVTFGIKVPAGIYVPSMVVGGLLGRMIGHVVQYIVLTNPGAAIFACPAGGGMESCVAPGVYALVAAGATMCGVTRLSVTLAVILFELTGSLDHVLPFSLSVLVAKWTADAIEPLSIYDLLTEMNNYPFLDSKIRPVFTTELGDITPRLRNQRVIDVSNSPVVSALKLRRKLQYLHDAGELDGGLPIVRNGLLVGLIPAPDLEFALDKLEEEGDTLCLMATLNPYNDNEADDDEVDPTNLTSYIDPAPVALDIHSPMDLVYQCFVKLGLRYICVLRDGQYAGLVHKKAFVKYIRELEEAGRSEKA